MKLQSLIKKAAVFFSSAAIIFSVSTNPALAADNSGYSTQKFSDLNVIVHIPNSMAVFTRTVSNNNSYLKNLGASDASEVRASMTATNTYLEAIPKDESTVSFELILAGKAADSNKLNLTNLSDEDIYKQFQTYVDYTNSSKTNSTSETFTGHEIYKAGDIVFFKTDLESEANNVKVYSSKYYTVIDGKEITIAGQSNKGELTSDQQTLLENVVDSAEFTPVAWTPFESVVFMEILHYFLSLGVPIIVLALIAFLIYRINKRRGSYYRR